ncbi:NADAR family protein [Lignipirellula cremea]|uniref:Swarming motility protein YbiA n=1 Tax=Lignipirellula cremea TaxID=2528010 RepID=A0A518DRV9_9BACT|nr:NADAR family protein [Lignipirellula cremea]QDU94563.1 Swarming motility protein YbiA [Lignipirellula cremea]
MLDLNQLRQRCATGETFTYLHFWGHTPPKDGSVGAACLSQWYPVLFQVQEVYYPTAEHWMMAEKARLFQDEEALLEILTADSPNQAKAWGRKVRNFDADQWNAQARGIVTAGNLAKFSQSDDLRDFLLGTGDQVLVEASPFDRIWGIGLKGTDPRAAHPDTWRGQNLLGFALMDVRQSLRETAE